MISCPSPAARRPVLIIVICPPLPLLHLLPVRLVATRATTTFTGTTLIPLLLILLVLLLRQRITLKIDEKQNVELFHSFIRSRPQRERYGGRPVVILSPCNYTAEGGELQLGAVNTPRGISLSDMQDIHQAAVCSVLGAVCSRNSSVRPSSSSR